MILYYNLLCKGKPDTLQKLQHNVSANTESSAVIQWQSPLYTGGPIIRYRINAVIARLHQSVVMCSPTPAGLDINIDYTVDVIVVWRVNQPMSQSILRLEVNNTMQLQNISMPLFTYTIIHVMYIYSPTYMPVLLSTEQQCHVTVADGRPVMIKWRVSGEVFLLTILFVCVYIRLQLR